MVKNNTRRVSRTRRNRRGGGFFNSVMGSSAPAPSKQQMAASAIGSVKAKGAYNLAHSKSKVANILSNPGTVRYTNKERIQSEIDEKIAKIEAEYGVTQSELARVADWADNVTPKSAVGSLKNLANQIESAIKSAGPTAAAVTLTIPIGLAQTAWKAMWIFISFWIVILSIPGNILGMANVSGLVTSTLPNANYTTTKNSFAFIKQYFKGE